MAMILKSGLACTNAQGRGVLASTVTLAYFWHLISAGSTLAGEAYNELLPTLEIPA